MFYSTRPHPNYVPNTRLASSMSDHTPVLFNVFEDWNEESVVPHISIDSIRIRFERKRPISRSLQYSWLNSAKQATGYSIVY